MGKHTWISQIGQPLASPFLVPCIPFPQVHRLSHVPIHNLAYSDNTHKTTFSGSSRDFGEFSLDSSDGFLRETMGFTSVVAFSRKLLCPVPHFRVDLNSVGGLGISKDRF